MKAGGPHLELKMVTVFRMRLRPRVLSSSYSYSYSVAPLAPTRSELPSSATLRVLSCKALISRTVDVRHSVRKSLNSLRAGTDGATR